MNDVKRRGRPGLEYNTDEIRKIINLYREHSGKSRKIEYADVCNFNLKLYNEGKCTKAYKIDFWRKCNQPGRKEVDDANELSKSHIGKSDNLSIPDIRKVVYDNINEPEALIKRLEPLKRNFYSSQEKLLKAKQKLAAAEKVLALEKEKLRKQEYLNRLFQEGLFQMFRYSDSDDVSMVNQLRIIDSSTMKLTHKRIDNALRNMFNNPMEFYTMFGEVADNGLQHSTNVVPMNKTRSLLDDMKSNKPKKPDSI